ncbi:MAG: HD domain-containing phosphohydrolase [Acidobacteriota bacterium]
MSEILKPFSSQLTIEHAKILIIDDEPNILSVLYSLLSDKHECKIASSAPEALEYFKTDQFDLILSDIMMPGMTGFELLEILKKSEDCPVLIFISGNLNIESAIGALRRGAYDYVTKPFNLDDVEIAVERGLRHQALIKSNQQYERHLEELVSLRTYELRLTNNSLNATLEKLYMSYKATLQALAKALEARDAETKGHSERVVSYCLGLGKKLSIAGRDLITLEHGALLHDIGKIGVPDGILLKKGSLTDEEWSHMRRHVEFGSDILSGIEFLSGARKIVQQHHERFDGSGYPSRLGGDLICQGARIFAVADAVDAITSDRPYRKGRPFEDAADELIKCSGKHFDPQVVEAFTNIPMDTWREIRQMTMDPSLKKQAQKLSPFNEINNSLLSLANE